MNLQQRQQLGARAARSRLASEDFLPSLSSLWKPGDYFAMIFPAYVFEGIRDFPIGEKYGHEINLPKELGFKRSWIPTTVEEFGPDLKPIGEDYLTRLASLSSAIKKGSRERQVNMQKQFAPSEEALAVSIKQIDEGMRNIRPIVGRRRQKIVVEGLFLMLDINHRADKDKLDFEHFQYGISNTKFKDLISLLDKSKYFKEEDGYFYVVMETDSTKEKDDAGKADWKLPQLKLEDAYEDFSKIVKNHLDNADISKETIESRFYNFKPIEKGEVLGAVASTLKAQLGNLKDLDNKTYFEFATEQTVVDALDAVELTADAEAIKAILAESQANAEYENVNNNLDAELANLEAQQVPSQQGDAQAQQLDINNINIQSEEVAPNNQGVSVDPNMAQAPSAPAAPVAN